LVLRRSSTSPCRLHVHTGKMLPGAYCCGCGLCCPTGHSTLWVWKICATIQCTIEDTGNVVRCRYPESRSAAYVISSSKSLHTVVQRKWLSRRNCNECEGVWSCDSGTYGRFVGGGGGGGCAGFSLDIWLKTRGWGESTDMQYANLFNPLPLTLFCPNQAW
jgi:hypothetical protein